ncbi:MAG: hypothetical protein ACRCZB_02865 [Bacteroidales bacterium]
MNKNGNILTPDFGKMLTNKEHTIYTRVVLLSNNDSEINWEDITKAQMEEEIRNKQELKNKQNGE